MNIFYKNIDNMNIFSIITLNMYYGVNYGNKKS